MHVCTRRASSAFGEIAGASSGTRFEAAAGGSSSGGVETLVTFIVGSAAGGADAVMSAAAGAIAALSAAGIRARELDAGELCECAAGSEGEE